MRVNDALHIRPRLEDFRVDINLAMAPRRARHDIAVEVDSEDVFHRELVKPDAVRLHEEPRGIVGQPHRNMAARKIVLTFGDKHFAGEDEFSFDFVMRHFDGVLVAFRHGKVDLATDIEGMQWAPAQGCRPRSMPTLQLFTAPSVNPPTM